jgi:hypothetical protein
MSQYTAQMARANGMPRAYGGAAGGGLARAAAGNNPMPCLFYTLSLLWSNGKSNFAL